MDLFRLIMLLCLNEIMRRIILALQIIFLVGCVDHVDGDKFDLISIEAESFIFFEPISEVGTIDALYPEYIYSLSPKRVWIEPEGVYIRLHEFMSKESGIFVLRPGVTEPKNLNYHPEFKHLERKVYSYVIED